MNGGSDLYRNSHSSKLFYNGWPAPFIVEGQPETNGTEI